MWTIAKQFDFCYGHRVWSQELNSEFSLDSCLKCRHLHGHQGVINVSLQSPTLVSGMVTDFKHLNWFKKWLDDTLDHKFIMDINDPLLRYELPILFPNGETTPAFYLLETDSLSGCWFIGNLPVDIEPCLREKYEGVVLIDFVPTSENLSRWFLDLIQRKMNNLGVRVSSIQFFETPKSQSIYSS